MRVADYIMSFISDQLEVDTIFMLSGGGIMHMMDAVACNMKLNYICSHNEQATTMQSDGYSKVSKKIGVALVTTGPGATNAITGVVGAWQDSTAMLVLSGQSKLQQTIYNSELKNLRQFGAQEVNILPLIESVTKYSAMISNPNDVRYHLEKAIYLSKNGRPGPVWLDIPLDVQGAIVDENSLKGFDPVQEGLVLPDEEDSIRENVKDLFNMIRVAKRPVIVAGNGINISNAAEAFNKMVELLRIPIITPRLGIDLISSDNRYFIGRPGIKGDRAGNFAVQNSDLVISIGSRLSINVIGHEYKKFARGAKVIVVDIDEEEHQKKTISIDMFIKCDAHMFISEMNAYAMNEQKLDFNTWTNICNVWKEKYPVMLSEYSSQNTPINTYYFTDELSKCMNDRDVIIIDSGSSSYVVSQSIKIKKGQKYIASGGLGSMGYAVPAAIGASVALDCGRVVCITGDGSFHMNIQELQTIVHNKLPIKMFIYNNYGYASIKATQNNYFQNRFVGVDETSGVSLPDILKVADLYGIKGFKVENTSEVVSVITDVLKYEGPVICEVVCSQDQKIIPTVYSLKKEDGSMISKPLEDMYPFLERDIFNNEMIIEPVKE